ncbi:unnamed protein product [Coregonus sp. 'balchen']|nr:unnamed protein product [Coregonus sp. 'balchen']
MDVLHDESFTSVSPSCDTPGSPVSQQATPHNHTTADTSKHLAAILCPMVVIGILAVIILLCIRSPRR